MKEMGDKDRVLSFTAPAPPPRHPQPPAAATTYQKPPTVPAPPAAAAAATRAAKAATPPPTQQPRRKSSDKDITTPARRMRIVYEFTKVFVLKKVVPEGIQAAIVLMRKIEAGEVVLFAELVRDERRLTHVLQY